MSSFVGHSLAGWTTYIMTRRLAGAGNADLLENATEHSPGWRWLLWLLVVASIPDIDYLIPALRVQHASQVLRITHSFVGVLVVPICTILVLWLLGKRGQSYRLQSLQVVLVGLSHLLLDLLTGVFPLPLLYPFSTMTFRLPFGLLPSAGRIQLTNYFLYRNLLIELGVLIPFSMSLLLSVQNSVRSQQRLLAIASGFVISVCFMAWAFNLNR